MKTIIVLTDFSGHALNALKAAAQIAKKTKSKIKLVHASNVPATPDGFEHFHYYDKFYHEVKTEAEEQIERLSQLDFLKGVEVEKHLVPDLLIWELQHDEWFKNAYLIVMGSHGASGFSEGFIGSNTEKIVRLAESPVLTINDGAGDFDVKKMVFASNFLKESYKSFEKIKSFSDIYNAHIYLLKVITPHEFESTPVSQELIGEFIQKFDLKNYSVNIYNSPHIETGIIDFGNETDADLIAVETHGRTGFAHLINGSLAEDVVKHETKPVLSIKIKIPNEPREHVMGFRSGYSNWGHE